MRNAALALGFFAVVSCLAFLSNDTSAQNAFAPQQTHWEYKVVHINKLVGDAKDLDAIISGLEDGLNDLGKQQWELCLEINGGVVLKRPR